MNLIKFKHVTNEVKLPQREIPTSRMPTLFHLLVGKVECLFEWWRSELGLLWGSGGVSFRGGRGREVQTWGWWRRGPRSSLEGEQEMTQESDCIHRTLFLCFPCLHVRWAVFPCFSSKTSLSVYGLTLISMSAVSVMLFPAQQSCYPSDVKGQQGQTKHFDLDQRHYMFVLLISGGILYKCEQLTLTQVTDRRSTPVWT